MGQIRETRCGYEYVSDNGIVYDIGENGADFNIIIDTFDDCDKQFSALAPFGFHLVDYVFGDLHDEEVIEWIDERVARYENHERILRFYVNEFCECYIGFKEEKYTPIKRVPKEILLAKK